MHRARDLVHLDLETEGLDATDETKRIMGIGLASPAGCWYFATHAWPPDHPAWAELREVLAEVGWSSFNTTFDGSWLWRYWGGLQGYVRPAYCTYTAFRALTTEGWPGQRWTLEAAVRDVLGQESHKEVLLELLVKHGLKSSTGKPDKSQMWRLAFLEPAEFGKYCGLDAEGAFQLGQVFGPIIEQYPALARQLREDWVTMSALAIEQQHAGAEVDLSLLHRRYAACQARMAEIDVALAEHPQSGPLVREEERRLVAEFYAPSVAYRRTRAEPAEWATLNAQATEAGVEFVSGLEWPLGGHKWIFATSKSKSLSAGQRAVGGYWYRETPVFTPRNQDKPPPKVNWASDRWVRKVLYTLYPAVELPADELHPKRFSVAGEHGDVVVEATDGGLPPVNLDVMPAFGEVGKLLSERSETEKEASYIASYIESSRDGKVHFRCKIPGTITLRLSGDGGLNFQQIPKVAEVMSAFKPPKGWGLIDLDFASLEPKVMAYFSQDPGYLELFASGQLHDVYLWMAQRMFPDAGIAEVYAPGGKTSKESIAAAKRQFKTLRELVKRIHLAVGYGAGAEKIYTQIRISGEMPEITLPDVVEKRRDYWRILAGIKDWERQLKEERAANGGWIYDGLGLPTAIAEVKLKDIVNTFCQKTGHGALLRFVYYIDKFRRERGVPMRPFLADMHDATNWAYLLGHEADAKAVFDDAMAALNQELTPPPPPPGVIIPPFVPLTGSTEYGMSLWDFKKE